MYREVLEQLERHRDKLAAAIDVIRQWADRDEPIAPTETIIQGNVIHRRLSTRRKALRAAPVGKRRLKSKRRLVNADTTIAVRQLTAARDYAVLHYLREHNGLAERGALAKAMPREANLSADQQRAALTNTLSRLKSLGYVARSGSVWSLTEKGRLAA